MRLSMWMRWGKFYTFARFISNAVGNALDEHLNVLLVPMCKKAFDKRFRDKVIHVLQCIEQNSGPGVVKIIKAKCPTFQPLH